MYYKIINAVIKEITREEAFESIKELCKTPYIGFDLETGGLDYNAPILLYCFGNEDFQIVTTEYEESFIRAVYTDSIIVGQNLKFDLSMIYWQYDLLPNKTVWDTMIVEQRIWQGFGRCKMNPNPISFGLEAITQRRVKEERLTTKDVRHHFIGKTKDTYRVCEEDLIYVAEDVKHLIPILHSQRKQVESFELNHLIYNIELPLVKVLVRMERVGFDFDVDAWSKILKENIETRYKLLNELDNWVANYAIENNLTDMFDMNLLQRERMRDVTIATTDLFGNKIDPKLAFRIPKSKKINFETSRMNYSSDKQIIELFAKLGFELPTNSGTHLVPIMVRKKDKIVIEESMGIYPYHFEEYNWEEDSQKAKYHIRHTGFKTGIPALEEYKLLNPKFKGNEFIDILAKYSTVTTEVTNYGQNYIDKVNPITNRIHTIYRQCEAVTGRLQSGGGNKQPDKFNSQNIKRENQYRNCFGGGKGYSVFTNDLSGAEVVILADKANDKTLIKLAIIDDDVHSPVAQACWRNVYLYRAGIGLYWNNPKEFKEFSGGVKNDINNFTINASRVIAYNKSISLIISKKENKNLRDAFKAITFGTVYGMFAKKCANSLNISLEEGQVVIDTIKSIIPETFKLITNNIDFAMGKKYEGRWSKNPNGFLRLNDYSKSRLWFPEMLKVIKTKGAYSPHFGDINKMEGNARNAPIQGTQADMMKEAMVVATDIIVKGNYPVDLIIQVHDELVGKCPKRYDGVSEEYFKDPHHINFTHDNGTQLALPAPLFVKEIMTMVANRYLTNIKMAASCEVADFWLK